MSSLASPTSTVVPILLLPVRTKESCCTTCRPNSQSGRECSIRASCTSPQCMSLCFSVPLARLKCVSDHLIKILFFTGRLLRASSLQSTTHGKHAQRDRSHHGASHCRHDTVPHRAHRLKCRSDATLGETGSNQFSPILMPALVSSSGTFARLTGHRRSQRLRRWQA